VLHEVTCRYFRCVVIADFQVQFTSLKMSLQNNNIFKRNDMKLSCRMYYMCDFSYKYYTRIRIFVYMYVSILIQYLLYDIVMVFDMECYLYLLCALSSSVLFLFI
jgi:hypothetical protein